MKKILFVMLLCSATASAQQKWSLRQCIDYAVEHNLQIRQGVVNSYKQELSVNTAKNSRLPDLSASASENLSFGRGLTAENTYTNRNTSSTSFSLGTSVPLFTGYRIPRTLELEKLNLQAIDVRMNVAQAYVQILYNMELLDVALRQVSIDSMQVVRLNTMKNNGKASGVEVAQQEATLSQSRLTVTQAANDMRLSLLSLSQLLELPSPEGFNIERIAADKLPTPSMSFPSPDVIYQEAVAVKPEILAEQYRLEGAEKSIDIAKSASLPSLTFQAGLGSNSGRTGKQLL